MEYEIRPEKNLRTSFSELKSYKDLLFFLIWRDLKVKYKQTVLGFVWVILQPLLITALVSMIIIKGFGNEINKYEYSMFLFLGYIIWMFFSAAVSGASSSMVGNAHIIKKIFFPRILLPFSSVLSVLPDLLILIVFSMIGVLLIPDIHFDFISLLYAWPAAIFLILISATGIGLFFCALQVRYRDVKFIVPFILQLGMFASPVFYPIPSSLMENKIFAIIINLNPVKGAIDLFRIPLSGEIPEMKWLIVSILSALVFFFAGLFYFHKSEKDFADIA
jgi:lipopolysaccharide transport system permease protein